MRYLLDTNIISNLIRNPSGAIADRIAEVGESEICTSIIVAAELRYGAQKKGSGRLAARVEEIIGAMEVLSLELPVDIYYGRLRTELENQGNLIGPNDLLIAAQAMVHGFILVTDNVREFSKVDGLIIENWLRW
jgi:tRNA(fMet)-specific endonuclease VapC